MHVNSGVWVFITDINQLLEKLQPLLEKEGLVLFQPLNVRDGHTVLETTITDGEHDVTTSIILPDGVKPQDMGSAITYYRRYSIVSLLALQAEDDDAKSANYGKDSSGEPFSKKAKTYMTNAERAQANKEVKEAYDNGEAPF